MADLSELKAQIIVELQRLCGTESGIEAGSSALELAGCRIWELVNDLHESRKALAASEERLRLASEAAGVGFWDHDLATDELHWSDKCKDLFGLPPDADVTFAMFLNAIHPDDRSHVLRQARSLDRHRQDQQMEYRVILPNGSIRWLLDIGRLLVEADWTAVRKVGVVLDITQRKLMEEELCNLNRTLRGRINIRQAIIRHENESDLLDEVCRIIVTDCGHSRAWIGMAEDDEKKSVRPVAQAGFDPAYLDSLDITWSDEEKGCGPTGTAVRTGAPSACRNMLTDPTMQPWAEQVQKGGYASIVAFPLKSDGRVFGALTIYTRNPESFSDAELKLLGEISDDLAFAIASIRLRKAHQSAQAALGYSEALLQAITDNSPDPIFLKDRNSRMLLANPATLSVLGKRAEEVIGKSASEYFDPPLARTILKNDREVIEGGCTRVVEEALNGPRGSRTFLTTKTPCFDSEGRPIGIIGISRDITERKKIEEELVNARKELELRVQERTAELERANQQLRQIPSRLIAAQEKERKRIGGELHDSIGQTLAALKYWVEMILLERDQGKFELALSRLEQFVPSLQRSIEETRAIYMGLRPSMLETLGVISTLTWFCREFQRIYPTHHLELSVVLVEDDIPEPLKIVIFRITQESLNNIAKHSRAEWVDISLGKGGGGIELSIADDGVGFGPGETGAQAEGRSLGLTGMQERAEATGGTLSIISKSGEGTTIRCVWPADAIPVLMSRDTDMS